jgi:hypothetical protein
LDANDDIKIKFMISDRYKAVKKKLKNKKWKKRWKVKEKLQEISIFHQNEVEERSCLGEMITDSQYLGFKGNIRLEMILEDILWMKEDRNKIFMKIR